MNFENKIYKEDIEENVFNEKINWKLLKNKNIFVTGATGLLGSLLVNTIIYANYEYNLNCKVIALVRNLNKAKKMFEKQLIFNKGQLEFIEGNIVDEIIYNGNIDYIIHAASQTSSKFFIQNSLETIDINLRGTRNVLELAKKKNISKFIFFSTMEVYGHPSTDEKITEEHGIDLSTINTRNCYPISKIMCENLCTCYANKYNFIISIIRLTQTFGSGVRYEDERVFAEFARCVIETRDIILHTKGDTKRSYLYVSDAISAVLQILLKNSENNIYNLANEDTYCSILEMANLVSKNNQNIRVKCIVEENLNKFGYAPTLHMNLDTEKIKKLGWKAKKDLEEMYIRMIEFMKDEQEGAKK